MPSKVSASAGSWVVALAQQLFDVGLHVRSAGGHVVTVDHSSFSVDEEFLKVPADVVVTQWVIVQPLGVFVIVTRRRTFPLLT